MGKFIKLTPYVLPELNANQPHQSTNRPITALTGDPKGKGSLPLSYRPSRGPSIIALANAALPPILKVNSINTV